MMEARGFVAERVQTFDTLAQKLKILEVGHNLVTVEENRNVANS